MTRDRITRTLEQEDKSRWTEATLSVHQRPEETLTSSLLERLETAVNELQYNLPEEVTQDLIYYIYRGSLNDQVRETLEKAHLFTNRPGS